MSVFEILSLRSEFEEIVLNYRVPGERKPGTLRNLKWFTKYASEKNARKPDFSRALEIAKTIVQHEKDRKSKK